MSREICRHEICTGCSACRDVCPKQCISMQPDGMDALYPKIDEDSCIDCGLCDKTCPNNRHFDFHHPQRVLAAWSSDINVRKTSASGGIACELYKSWIRKGGVATGVVYNREEGCHFILIEKEGDIAATKNSKYTFSDTAGIYAVVKRKLQEGIPVLFIGVPCQVAGLYGFLKQDYANLTTVDIICHGMPPAEYLKQHVESIEKRKKEHTDELLFRDPKYYTYTFTFTLKNALGKEFYSKKVLATDNYQLGYHRALIYRENCYQCRYARKERIADLTIGDFSGLGSVSPVKYQLVNTSCILVNTIKGSETLEKIHSLMIDERPAEEAFNVEKQLKAPSLKHFRRDIFVQTYRESRDFEEAANRSLIEEKKMAKKQRWRLKAKELVKAIVPHPFVKIIKNIISR